MLERITSRIRNAFTSVESNTIQPSAIELLVKDELPFSIRGHHLIEFVYLVQYDVKPASAAELMVAKYRRQLKKPIRERNPYVDDTVGSRRKLRQFGMSLQELYETFNGLPGEYPIEILEGQKDTMCINCVTGKGEHCTLKYPYPSNPQKDNINGDGKYLDKFLEISQQLGLSDSVITDTQTASFTDSPPVDVRVLTTQASTVRSVLNNWELSLTF